jgi:hypothetical protein
LKAMTRPLRKKVQPYATNITALSIGEYDGIK